MVWISLQAHGPCTYRWLRVPQCSLWNSTCSAYWLWTFHSTRQVDQGQSFLQFLSNGASLLVVGTGPLWPRVGRSWRMLSTRVCVPTHTRIGNQLYNDQWAEQIQEFDLCKVQLIFITSHLTSKFFVSSDSWHTSRVPRTFISVASFKESSKRTLAATWYTICTLSVIVLRSVADRPANAHQQH